MHIYTCAYAHKHTHTWTQITNTKTLEADRQALLSLMYSEVAELVSFYTRYEYKMHACACGIYTEKL
jgi:hypothetical protein